MTPSKYNSSRPHPPSRPFPRQFPLQHAPSLVGAHPVTSPMSPKRPVKNPSDRGESSSSRHGHTPDAFTPRHHMGPGYMTVGSGSTPEATARLVSMLDEDSGYGASLAEGEGANLPTPILNGESSFSEHDRQRSHVLQLRYNQNKNALGRAIHGTIDTLKTSQEMNLKWPAHYPSVQVETQRSHLRTDSRPGLQHTQPAIGGDFEPSLRSPDRPRPPRRTGTTVGDEPVAESSSAAAAKETKVEPRLVTPKLAHDFSVLKLELRMGGRNQTDLVHSLEKSSIASLLDGQIQQSKKHLYSIKERIQDTSSKVLVTRDLNAGKSTFCNALLRHKVLPEDQQPCTSIFCEVLDFRENTYIVFALEDLEKIVVGNGHFSQCKIYIKDIQDVDESILNHGVVDIALINAPGEEIDVVVFVVSAANHFTKSAKNFIFSAAQEKAYMFIVVHGFNTIRDVPLEGLRSSQVALYRTKSRRP
ncbi:predicted protein [Plenodomus lingam JN3]|uniref:Predicted protein n=1 Tax=Leptosphaeria maculans (strain JN3 / isolate v23.1.3 / race Av1-4-5-6-7-8) TaxID=985895 RepID=E5A571_LEPMJ|nr:predicted protein [Plenodomus lingam JN3]CBX98769.1 predicted protein [Plenodomus lingam JN3]